MKWLEVTSRRIVEDSRANKSQAKIRELPEYKDRLSIPSVSVMGLKVPSVVIQIPGMNVSKNRRFVKGIDWALEKLFSPPSQELAAQEAVAARVISRYKGAQFSDIHRLNKMSPFTMIRIYDPLHIIFNKMDKIAVSKGGGSARALESGGDRFWYGVFRLKQEMEAEAPWDEMDEWSFKEACRLWEKYAGLKVNPLTGGFFLTPQSEGEETDGDPLEEDTTSANAGIVGIPIGSRIVPKNPWGYRRVRPKWIDEILASVGAGRSATS